MRRLQQALDADARMAVSPRVSSPSPELQTIRPLPTMGPSWLLPSPDSVPRWSIGTAQDPLYAAPHPLWDLGRRSNGDFRWRDENAPFRLPVFDESARVWALEYGSPLHTMHPLDPGTPFMVANNLADISKDKRISNPLAYSQVSWRQQTRGETPDSAFADAWADAITSKASIFLSERPKRKRDHQYPALHSASALETRRCSIGVDLPLGETVLSVSQALAPLPEGDARDEDSALFWLQSGAASTSRIGSLPFESPEGEPLSAKAIGQIGRLDAFIARSTAADARAVDDLRKSNALADADLLVMHGTEFHVFSAVELGIEQLGLASPPEMIEYSLRTDHGPLVEDHRVYSSNKKSLPDIELVYRDENSKRIVWPWEPPQPFGGVTGVKRQREGTEYDRGFHMYFNSTPPGMAQFAVERARQAHSLIDRAREAPASRLDYLINEALNNATADGKRGAKHTGVKAWIAFCIDLGVPWIRVLDPCAPLADKLDEEWLAMRFIAALVEERGINATTAAGYFSSVQGYMARETGVKLAGGMKLERLPQMIKGLRRMHGERHKPLRRPISPDKLRHAMDRILDPTNPAHANMRAAIATAFQGLLRSAEYTGLRGKNTILRSDLKQLSLEQLVVMMHPCKNMHHIHGKTCPLVIGGGGKYIDACAEIVNLLKVDNTRGHPDDDVPLFRDPATNKPISYHDMNALIKQIYQVAGIPLDECGTHIMRISGATALFAAGGSDTIVRTMGRWSSDLYRLYVRACYEQCTAWSSKMGSTTFSPTAVVYDEVDDY